MTERPITVVFYVLFPPPFSAAFSSLPYEIVSAENILQIIKASHEAGHYDA